jgi:hypothetical protein
MVFLFDHRQFPEFCCLTEVCGGLWWCFFLVCLLVCGDFILLHAISAGHGTSAQFQRFAAYNNLTIRYN